MTRRFFLELREKREKERERNRGETTKINKNIIILSEKINLIEFIHICVRFIRLILSLLKQKS